MKLVSFKNMLFLLVVVAAWFYLVFYVPLSYPGLVWLSSVGAFLVICGTLSIVSYRPPLIPLVYLGGIFIALYVAPTYDNVYRNLGNIAILFGLIMVPWLYLLTLIPQLWSLWIRIFGTWVCVMEFPEEEAFFLLGNSGKFLRNASPKKHPLFTDDLDKARLFEDEQKAWEYALKGNLAVQF